MRIAIGTTSELKLRAVANAMSRAGILAEMKSFSVPSEVSKQPFSRSEMTLGAKTRAQKALYEDGYAQYGLGIESGIVHEEGLYFELAVCVFIDREFKIAGMSFSAAVETPEKIVNLIKAENSEAGVVVGKITGNPEKDPVAYYTGGKMMREELLQDAVFLAFSRALLNPEAYK